MDDHSWILRTQNRDREIEFFWLTFKDSMKNIKKVYSNCEFDKINIDKISEELNSLQRKAQELEQIDNIRHQKLITENYNQIEHKIFNTLEDFTDELIYLGKYHVNIHYSFIKKWNNITKLYPLTTSSESYVTFIMHKLILKYLESKKPGAEQLQEYLRDGDYESMLDVAIRHNYATIIDKLRHVIDVNFHIEETYGHKLGKSMISGLKIIRLLAQKYNLQE